MYSPPQPLEKPFFKPTICQSRLEVYKIRVIKRENNNSDSNSESESESEMQFPVDDPLKDEYKATEDPEKFKGRIFIGNKYFFQEMYNSKAEFSLYVDLLTNQSNKLKEEEEYFPLMGPEIGIMVEDCFHVIVHPDADNVGADEKYEDAARAKYLKPIFGFIPTDYVRPGRVPWPTALFDTPFEFEVSTARHLVTLDCVMHKHSKAVHLEIKWLNQQHATTEHMYIFGQIYVTSPAFPFKLSYLLDTPPYKAVKAQLGMPIPLLRSVVALPYDNNFVVKARLFYSNTIAEEFRFHPLVHDDVTFPFVDEDKDAVASTFCPSHPFERYGLYSPVTYESKKLIRDSGSGCLLEVTAKVDVK